MWIEAVYFLFWSDMLFIDFLSETGGVQHNIFSDIFIKIIIFHTIQMILANPFNSTL